MSPKRFPLTRALPVLALVAALAGCSKPGGKDDAPQMMKAPTDPSLQAQAKGFDETATAIQKQAEQLKQEMGSPLDLFSTVVDTLEKEGKDVSKEHTITFHIVFPTEEYAKKAAASFEKAGMTTAVAPPAGDGAQWQVDATVTTVPSSITFQKVAAAVTAQVEELEGEYQSWSSS